MALTPSMGTSIAALAERRDHVAAVADEPPRPPRPPSSAPLRPQPAGKAQARSEAAQAREAAVVAARGRRQSFAAIGRAMGISAQRAHQLHTRAMKRACKAADVPDA